MSNIKNISAENCYSTIKENKDAYLVDVRTPYEWETFGRVDNESFDARYIELTLINEEGDEKSGHGGQSDFHRTCFEQNFNKDVYI